MDETLLDTLHPTPAVGGHPSKEALAYLSGSEPFARGLYAAPLGWTGVQSADFAVGIRSCLIESQPRLSICRNGHCRRVGSPPRMGGDPA